MPGQPAATGQISRKIQDLGPLPPIQPCLSFKQCIKYGLYLLCREQEEQRRQQELQARQQKAEAEAAARRSAEEAQARARAEQLARKRSAEAARAQARAAAEVQRRQHAAEARVGCGTRGGPSAHTCVKQHPWQLHAPCSGAIICGWQLGLY